MSWNDEGKHGRCGRLPRWYCKAGRYAWGMREAWTGRTFDFDYPVTRIGVFLSRIRGTGARIPAAVRGMSPQALAARPDGKWSVQEHVGHLFELDALHLRRLDELSAGASELSAADMDNRATWDADYNSAAFADVFGQFEERRAELIRRLASLDEQGLARTARHPRLQTPMRAVDVAFFCAEHDDNHVAAIETIAANNKHAPAPAMSAHWHDLPHDAPMPLLERHRIVGSDAMISHITLHEGCDVPVHAHANEQFACVLSGKVRFTLADGETRVLEGGEVLHLPGFAPHGAYAIETSVVLDIFSPPSEATGIDDRS